MDKYSAFLFDVGHEIKSRAREAKERRDHSRQGSEDHSLQFGRTVAFSEVLGIMQSTAHSLGIPLSELRLDDIDPDSELL